MTEKFQRAVAIVLENEGGYVNDLNDPGGETKYGISKRSYPSVDIKNLTTDRAKAIYFRDFWQPIKAESINDDRLATHYFDVAVNSGKGRAIRMLEEITGSARTGVISMDTIVKANILPDGPARFVKARREFYNNLAEIRPNMKVYLKGWMNRINHIEKKNWP